MKYFLLVAIIFLSYLVQAQQQACPPNSSFSTGTLTNWLAYTGNNREGNGPGAIKVEYLPNVAAPTGTIGATVIYEYNLGSVPGIQVLSNASADPYGGFSTVPNINGFQYTNSVLLGSTSITRSNSAGDQGGYVRGVRYTINVPAGPAAQPYTMTYAYAMVLENGTHNSNQQPLFSATLTVNNTVITCASPKYYLPTKNNADPRGSGATLDTAAAVSQGFSLSSRRSPNTDPNNPSPNAPHLQDVWTKNWTEVTFDLSSYRGQQVVLTFETDNCIPGGHFAYSYVALRNVCDGLTISGPPVGCIGTTRTYSVPALGGATYQWTVPVGWTINSGANGNILQVTISDNAVAGNITCHAQNSCANLLATLAVTTIASTQAGAVGNDAEVCTGTNSTPLNLTSYRGNIVNWQSSPDGVNFTPFSNTQSVYLAQNLTATTYYNAVVQNGPYCDALTSTAAKVLVDPLSVGGSLNPSALEVCTNQFKDASLKLINNVGNPMNWQTSPDNVNWSDMSPVYTATQYDLVNLPSSTWYRVIVKSGVCPAVLSSSSFVRVLPDIFPQAVTGPADTAICYGTTALLHGTITVGTSYSWTPVSTLTNTGDGQISALPLSIQTTAAPKDTTLYVISILNTGCPNPLLDSFKVNVIPPIIVNAGNDTSIVYNQPLQLHAYSNNATTSFSWTPTLGLNDPGIPDPLAILGAGTDSVRYFVKATTPEGCFGTANILVKVFKTLPDIFVPNAFTPGKASNGIFRPIPVGIASFQFFRVYNRWGQLVYSTSQSGAGWDGRVNGHLQDPGTYVWMAQGKSYTGNTVFRKGTVILIR